VFTKAGTDPYPEPHEYSSTHGRHEKFVENFGWKPVGKISFGRPRRRREDNNEIGLK
jgi:hypothetical protein